MKDVDLLESLRLLDQYYVIRILPVLLFISRYM